MDGFSSNWNEMKALVEEILILCTHVVLGDFLTWFNGLIFDREPRRSRLFVVTQLYTTREAFILRTLYI